MSKHYDEVWRLIEALDGISAQLGDLLDAERDRRAKPRLRQAIQMIEAAVAELENVDPDDPDDDVPPPGSIIIGKFL